MKDTEIRHKTAITAAVIGFTASSYRPVQKRTRKLSMRMEGFADWWTVNDRNFSIIRAITVTFLGVMAFLLAIVLLTTSGSDLIYTLNKYQDIYGFAFLGLIYSIYLTYLEITVIKAVCPFYVQFATIVSIILLYSIMRLVQNRRDLNLSLEDKNG